MITQKSVEEILSTAKVEEVIEDFVNLRRRGVNMLGLCPFHDEKTPSFTVSPAKNIYKCFGCGKGGTPVQFVMDHEGFSYPEALKYLARKYNIQIEETEFTKEEKETKEKKDSLYIVNEYARDFFSDKLFNSDEGKSIGLSYFKQRGYREGTIKKFGLGYATKERDDFTSTAVNAQYNIEFLRELGLTSSSNLDFFRSRVMFTIHNLSGKVIAFAGRTLSSDKKIPKYINSPESEIYNKRKILYGMFHAKNAIRKFDECIIVEGYTDVITLNQGGVENVVASSGTSLTSDQIRLVKRYSQNIKIIYDGDPAGIKAALRGLDLVLEQDMNVRLVLLPEGEDPDSFFSSSGVEGFRNYLKENEKDFIFFKIDLLMEEAGKDPIKRAGVLKDIISSIARIPDTLKRSMYIKQCSRQLDIEENILVAETNKTIKANLKVKRQERDREAYRLQRQFPEESFITEKKDKKEIQVQPNVTVAKDENQEKDIIRILISMGHKIIKESGKVTVAQYLISNLESDIHSFDNNLYSLILTIVKDKIEKGEVLEPSFYTNHPNENIRNLAIDIMATPYAYASWEEKGIFLQTQKVPEENFEKDSYQAILRFKLQKIKKMIHSMQEKLKDPSPETQESDDYLINIKVLQKLMEQRNNIASELKTIVFR